jgi:ubiquinone/menaquinone biosynthesis C-methylase UbiE
MPKAIYDYESIPVGYYDKIFDKGKGIQSCWHHLKFLAVKNLVMEHDTKTLLDVGCGPGTFLGNFINSNICAIGFDIASSQIDYATQKHNKENITFVGGGGDVLPFPSSHFDTVTCIELIEHLEKDQIDNLLKECHRVLKPNGRVIVTTPNYKSLWVLLEKIVNTVSPVSYEDQHITHFNKKTLRECLEKNGFTADIRAYIGLAPFLAMLSWRLAKGTAKYEKWIEDHYGFSLIASCVKK